MDENKDSFKAAREQRKEKKNAEADRTTQTLDNAANVAQFTPIGGYAKAYKTFRAIDDRVTGGKLSRTLSKTANATGPGVKSLSKVGSSGLANNAGKALAAKEKLSGKGGGPSASGGNTPAMKTTTTSSNVSGTPSTIGGSKNTAKSNKDSKKINKEKKKKNNQSSISNQSSEKEEQTNLQSSSWAILMGEMTPMKIIILLIAAFVAIIVFLFIVLFSTIGNKLEFFKSQAFSEISSKVNNVSAGFSIGNINIIDNAMNFKDADYDFKQFNQDYESPGEGLVSASRDNSKRDTLLAWAKKFFPAEIYLNYFNIGNIFNTSDKKCYGDECNDRAEVLFYQKVADISFRYRKLYNIELDWPLIISTVLIKSTDKETTFANNLNDYTVLELNNLEEDMSLDWEYDYKDIQGYDYLSSDSRYDLQILAKNMVKKKTIQTCASADGKITKKLELEDIEDSLIEKSKKEVTAPNYKPDPTKEDEVYYLVCESGAKYNVSSTYSLDKEKYKNFLEEYVEKRYFIAGTSNNASGGATPYDDGDYSIPYGTDLSSTMINVATSQLGVNEKDGSFKKYWKHYSQFAKYDNIGWCACFIDWVVKNTEYGGIPLSSVIKQTSCAPKTFMDFFNSSSDANIRFYYNTKADKYKGRGPDYTPKAGDIIFFNWKCSWNSPSDGNNLISHVGIVTGSDGSTVYTIEGNTSDMVARRSHALNSCTVIGFGAWY